MTYQMGGAALRHLVHELEQRLAGGWLDNLYQLDPATFLLRFRSSVKGRQQLVIPLNGAPHLSEATFSTPASPTLATTLMRKRLRNSRLTAMRQPGLNRILNLAFSTKEGSRELVVELLRPANLLIVEEGLIVWVLKPRDHRHRSLRNGQAYALPPCRMDPTTLSPMELRQALTGLEEPLGRALSMGLDLGPQLANELFRRLGLDAQRRYDELEEVSQTALVEQILRLLDPSTTRPHLYLEEGRPVAVYPWPSHIDPGLEFQLLDSLSEGYSRLYQARAQQAREKAPRPAEERQTRRATRQAEAAKSYDEEAQALRCCARTLYDNYELAQRMLETLGQEVATGGWEALRSKVQVLPALLRVDPSRHLVWVKLADRELALDLQASLDQNASRLYDRAKRLAGKAERAREAERFTRSQPLPPPMTKPSTTEVPPQWYERYRWFIASTGNIVVAGKDAHSNELVVRRYLKEHDIFCHADLTGAPAVVVKHVDQEVSEAAAHQGCLFSLAYSKAWGARVASGHTYWSTADQVSRSPQAGEFVAKGSFIIRGQRHWHRNQPVEAGVGWVDLEPTGKLMGGPVPAVEQQCQRHVILRPGFLERKQVAKVLSQALEAPVEALERVLPPGPCDLVRSVGCQVQWPSTA